MIRTMIRNAAFLATLSLGLAGSQAQAAFSGTLPLAAFGASTSTGALDGGTATVFSFSSLQASSAGLGSFSYVPATAAFSGGSFSLSSATLLTFTSALYGTFTETSAPLVLSTSIQSLRLIIGHMMKTCINQ
jgi:hypothetical protein